MNVVRFIKKNSRGILLVCGIVSSLTSLYLTSKATLKIEKIKTEEDYKKTDIIKASVPPAITTAIALTCFIFVYVNSRKVEAGLTGAVITTNEILKGYRKELKELLGEEQEKEIYISEVEKVNGLKTKWVPDKSEGEELFCEPITGQFFYATVNDVMWSEMELNRNMALKDCVYFNEFLLFLGLKEKEDGDLFGWSTYSDQFYGYKWIDFEHIKRRREDGKEYYMINYPFPPHYDFEDPGECIGDDYELNVPDYEVNYG